MNRTRIVVPAIPRELDTPHFDDEATIVTARPVIPIAEAKAVERSRISVLILVGLLVAGLSGATGAFGIIYYRDHHSNSLSSGLPQTNQPPGFQSQPATTSTPESSTGLAASDSPSEPATSQQAVALAANPAEDPSLDKKTDATVIQKEESQIAKPVTSPGFSDKASTPPGDSSLLVRKRRVHPINERAEGSAPRVKSGKSKDQGAGRILEIFEGPNPP